MKRKKKRANEPSKPPKKRPTNLPHDCIYLGRGGRFFAPVDGFAGFCRLAGVQDNWVFSKCVFGKDEFLEYAVYANTRVALINEGITDE